MKIVREHIFEKFTEDSDPITDLNIGLIKEIRDWFSTVLTRESLPAEDWVLLNYCIEYDKHDYVKYFINSDISEKHKRAGFRYAIFKNKFKIVKLFLAAGYNIKDVINEKDVLHIRRFQLVSNFKLLDMINTAFPRKLSEKFIEDTDPVKDMGIGLKKFWQERCNIEGHISSVQSSINYFNTNKYDTESFAVYKVLNSICEADVTSQKEIQEIFEREIKDLAFNKKYLNKKYPRIIKNITKIAEALDKFFYISVDVTPFIKK